MSSDDPVRLQMFTPPLHILMLPQILQPNKIEAQGNSQGNLLGRLAHEVPSSGGGVVAGFSGV